ncbi:latent-transforming growth factor beta-binding protein 4-like [Anser cygnoides]|uniref:latent-transforming growth factor beta-binding protein 4-like n=1 Tax=Anser cygnoides TaxID=8845 RepID=UPI0034D3859F
MGPAGRLGLCLVLGLGPNSALGSPRSARSAWGRCASTPRTAPAPRLLAPHAWPKEEFVTCGDINECVERPPLRQRPALHQHPGGFRCSCIPGYRAAPPRATPPGPPEPPPLRCVDVNECEEGGCWGAPSASTPPAASSATAPPACGWTPTGAASP